MTQTNIPSVSGNPADDTKALGAGTGAPFTPAGGSAAITSPGGTIAVGGTPSAPQLDVSALVVTRTLVPGAPTAGTWAALSTIVDSNGTLWSTTAGGTPGTWFQGSNKGTVKRVTMPIGSSGSAVFTYSGGLDICERTLLRFPWPLQRFRIRIANTSPLTGTANAGALSLTGVWAGTPAAGLDATGRWNRQFASAPTQILPAQAMQADGSDFVSAWITPSTFQIPAQTPVALSFGINSGGVTITAPIDAVNMYSYVGSGASASAGNTALPTGTGSQNAVLDIRFEYEFLGGSDNLVVLGTGTSIMGGFENNPVNQTIWPYERWFDSACFRKGWAPINLGVGSSLAATWAANDTSWQYVRADLATTVPDIAVLEAGTNDLFVTVVSAATLEGYREAEIALMQSLGIKRILSCTIMPRAVGAAAGPSGFSLAEELARTGFNNWLGNMPDGLNGIVDLDKAIALPQPPLYTTATLVSGAGGNPITVASIGNGILFGASVVGSAGIPAGTQVSGVSGTSITLSNNPTTSGAVTLWITNPRVLADPDLIASQPHPTMRGAQIMSNALAAALA